MKGLTAVIIAGPSSRVFQQEFTFEGVITERINLREHVVWCHPANDEDTQMLAEDYMRMGITKTTKYEDRPPFMEAVDKEHSGHRRGHDGSDSRPRSGQSRLSGLLSWKRSPTRRMGQQISQGVYWQATV